jgi:hypothetical protein
MIMSMIATKDGTPIFFKKAGAPGDQCFFSRGYASFLLTALDMPDTRPPEHACMFPFAPARHYGSRDI